MKITMNSSHDSPFITLPRFGSIDFDKLQDEIHKRTNTDDINSPKFIHEGLSILMIALFKELGCNVRFNKRQDGCSVWEMDTPECFLTVFLKDGCLSYSVRVNTFTFKNRMSCCYFSCHHMRANFKSLLVRTMNDFAGLIHECRELTYDFKLRDDNIPRGMYHTNGSWFCSEHEEKILCPMHYYEGYINFPIDFSKSPNEYDFIPNDWDTWMQELGHISNDRLSDIEIFGLCLDRCMTQLKSYNKEIDLLNSKIKAEFESKFMRYKEILYENHHITK